MPDLDALPLPSARSTRPLPLEPAGPCCGLLLPLPWPPLPRLSCWLLAGMTPLLVLANCLMAGPPPPPPPLQASQIDSFAVRLTALAPWHP